MELLERQTGDGIYDLQLDRVPNLQADFDTVGADYADGIELLRRD